MSSGRARRGDNLGSTTNSAGARQTSWEHSSSPRCVASTLGTRRSESLPNTKGRLGCPYAIRAPYRTTHLSPRPRTIRCSSRSANQRVRDVDSSDDTISMNTDPNVDLKKTPFTNADAEITPKASRAATESGSLHFPMSHYRGRDWGAARDFRDSRDNIGGIEESRRRKRWKNEEENEERKTQHIHCLSTTFTQAPPRTFTSVPEPEPMLEGQCAQELSRSR